MTFFEIGSFSWNTVFDPNLDCRGVRNGANIPLYVKKNFCVFVARFNLVDKL